MQSYPSTRSKLSHPYHPKEPLKIPMYYPFSFTFTYLQNIVDVLDIAQDHRRVYVYPASPDLLQCQDLFGAQSLCYKSSSNSPTPINYAGGNGKLRSSGFWLRESFNIQISHQPTQPTGHNLISSSRIMTEDTIAVVCGLIFPVLLLF